MIVSKNTFTAAPRPAGLTDAEVAAFKFRGTGSDHANAGEPVKRLSVDIPAKLHMRFKTVRSATGRTMTAELLALVEDRTRSLEDEIGFGRRVSK